MIKLVVFACILIFGYSSACEVKDVQSQDYSTTDGLVIANTAYIVTFNVICKNLRSSESLTLHADIPALNKQLPVVYSPDNQRYQVSWTEELSKSGSATYEIRVYDEEGLSLWRRAQRKESTEEVKPLFKLQLTHPGTYKGPYIHTEMVATLVVIALSWFAYSNKAKLVA